MDITDGTSNTIGLIRVPTADAVAWTRPKDWKVNVAGLRIPKDEPLLCVTCDSKPRDINLANTSDNFLHALLTRNAGEVLNWERLTLLSNRTAEFRIAQRNGGTGDLEQFQQNPIAKISNQRSRFGFGVSQNQRFQMPENSFEEEGFDSSVSGPAPPVYAGRTFAQWMDVVRTDRQLKTKFAAFAAAAELAQGDATLRKEVLQQIKPLLRKHGSNVSSGAHPFRTDVLAGRPLKNRFRNQELTELFIEIFRRFPADDLMDFAIDEIKNGTVNSRKFLSHLWSPGSICVDDPPRQLKYIRSVDRHALEIANAMQDVAETCDPENRHALSHSLAAVQAFVALKIASGEDPLVAFYAKRKMTGEAFAEWNKLLTDAFESDQPSKRGLVAVPLARNFPDRPDLAKELAGMLADKKLPTDVRAAALYALRELPVAKIQSLGDTLLEVGKQSGPEKDQLISWTKKHYFYSTNPSVPFERKAAITPDMSVHSYIAVWLGQIEPPTKGALSWLKQQVEQINAMGKTQNAITIHQQQRSLSIFYAAIEALGGEVPPDFFSSNNDSRTGGGVF